MSEVIRIRVCGKHDEEFNEHGRCPYCCSEDHMCEQCGEHTDMNERGDFVCESCVTCTYCDGDPVDQFGIAPNVVDSDYMCHECALEQEHITAEEAAEEKVDRERLRAIWKANAEKANQQQQ